MKTILIPLAAFAVTVTGASAFNGDLLKRAGLDEQQIAAFEEAKELREAGDKEAARDVLIAAGVDEEVIQQVRRAMRESANAVRKAIESEDYDAFVIAVEGSPLAEIIDSEDEFNKLVEAHSLMKDGENADAKDIFDELGLPGHGFLAKFKDMKRSALFSQLSSEQREELREAIQNKDRERAREILEEAGVDTDNRFKRGWTHPGFGHWAKKGMEKHQ